MGEVQTVVTETAGGVAGALDQVLTQGILGALLILSIAGNVALVWALVRCYRFNAGVRNNG